MRKPTKAQLETLRLMSQGARVHVSPHVQRLIARGFAERVAIGAIITPAGLAAVHSKTKAGDQL